MTVVGMVQIGIIGHGSERMMMVLLLGYLLLMMG